MTDIGDAIKQQLKWNVNVAYLSKEKVKNALFISNRNNVKGLEFPFVICVTKQITSSSKYRSALYTMLTRSFCVHIYFYNEVIMRASEKRYLLVILRLKNTNV